MGTEVQSSMVRAVWYGTEQYGTEVQSSMVRAVWYGAEQYGMVQSSMVQRYRAVWYRGIEKYGTEQYGTEVQSSTTVQRYRAV